MSAPEKAAQRPRRVLVVGLDCLAPQLAFDRYRDAMPQLHALMRAGSWGVLRSCDPPITVPAWLVMATGRDPGTLGLYGFRHRRGGSYDDGWIATSRSIDEPTVWDRLGSAGRSACVVGVPPNYPPRPVNGTSIGCFLTPGPTSAFAHPPDVADRVLATAPEYRFDVPFRVEERDRVRDELHLMVDEHFDVVEELLEARPWELCWLVEIGTDRAHHAFWKYADPEHPRHEAGHRFADAIRELYAHVDRRLGRLVEQVGDDTAILVVSDHGAKAMRGALAVNEWLVREGWLTLLERPAPGSSFDAGLVDWSRTRAWAWGGYYARVFLNVRGREPEGIIDPAAVEETLAELTDALMTIPDHEGRPLRTSVFRPADLYATVRGDPPDLMVYFDDLSWRSAGTMGWPDIHLFENDTGPDEAVHAHEGCFVMRAPGVQPGERDGLTIYDVAPTLLDLLGLPVPADMKGNVCR